MVAKSYQGLQQIGDPFTSKGRQYVRVRTATGAEKTVRWYTESEYYKIYGEKAPEESKILRPLKDTLGFEKGYITIFKGDTYACKDWFSESAARYARFWGWYFISTDEVPAELPEGVEPIRLEWSKVSKDDNTLLPEDTIRAYVDTLIYGESTSEYYGNIGTRYQLSLTVRKVVPHETAYGISNIHTMEDDNGNIFVWATTARSLTPGVKYRMTAGVKDHKMYQGSKQTWLTRCLSISVDKQ